MTPQQRAVVDGLVNQGFKIVENSTEVVRLSKGSDKRLVRPDGTQKRANHIDPEIR